MRASEIQYLDDIYDIYLSYNTIYGFIYSILLKICRKEGIVTITLLFHFCCSCCSCACRMCIFSLQHQPKQNNNMWETYGIMRKGPICSMDGPQTATNMPLFCKPCKKKVSNLLILSINMNSSVCLDQ